MHRFYHPDIERTQALPEEESKHCVRVLRLVEGDEIEVVDGRGNLYRCRIVMAHPKRCSLEIVATQHVPPHWGHKIVIAVAPPKNIDRIEDMADRVTEMGVDRIVPLLCNNSERKVLKTERLRKILVAAMKQSLKATLPVLDEMTPLGTLLAEPFAGDKYIAYIDPSLPREQRKDFAQEYVPGHDTMIGRGPEGDFSPAEIEAALKAGFTPVSLGPSRLRTETAAMWAVAACHAIDQREKLIKQH